MSFGGTEIRATDFAITTVNVPDRLDQRDMDDRRQLEEDTRRAGFDGAAFRAWAPRLFLILLLSALAFVAFEVIDSWREDLSAASLSKKFTTELGVAVRIEGSHISFNPTPRLLLSNVTVDGRVVLKEISVNFASRNVAQIFQGRGWNWGEAIISPTTLTLEEAQSLLNLTPKLEKALPHSLSSLRFERLDISGVQWLAGSWNVVLGRSYSGAFTDVQATQRKDKGTIRFNLKPTEDLAGAEFQMESHDAVLPFGPRFAVEEAVATGLAYPVRVEVTSFSLGGPFGAIRGQLTASWDQNWTIDGSAVSEGLDVGSLLHSIDPPPNADEAAPGDSGSLIQGTASIDGHLAGKGALLQEAIDNTAFQAHVVVRSPVLNGINLGYAATHPGAATGASGGSTRFSNLDATIYATSKTTLFRDIHAKAGALAASGEVSLAPDHSMVGHLHVDLGATRVLAPIRVAVRGTLLHPEFGR